MSQSTCAGNHETGKIEVMTEPKVRKLSMSDLKSLRQAYRDRQHTIVQPGTGNSYLAYGTYQSNDPPSLTKPWIIENDGEVYVLATHVKELWTNGQKFGPCLMFHEYRRQDTHDSREEFLARHPIGDAGISHKAPVLIQQAKVKLLKILAKHPEGCSTSELYRDEVLDRNLEPRQIIKLLRSMPDKVEEGSYIRKNGEDIGSHWRWWKLKA